jgi:UDP-N-acetylglucosamine:LPS N-acetylglucosamine transferase
VVEEAGSIVRRCDVLAVSSGGGHWVQLLLLAPAFEGLRVLYVTSNSQASADLPAGSLAGVVPDANLRTPVRSLQCLWQVARVVRALRPRVVVSTGAAPGLFAVAVGSLLGAVTIWVESLAGVTRLTVSGRIARRVATHFIVQWPDLARNGAEHHGNLL